MFDVARLLALAWALTVAVRARWLPLAAPVVRWPARVNALAAVTLLVPARRLAAQIERLPQFSPDTKRADRVAVALYLVAVFEGVSAATRGLPWLLSGG